VDPADWMLSLADEEDRNDDVQPANWTEVCVLVVDNLIA